VTWTFWWGYVVTSIVLALAPGPAVMLVLSNALQFGARRTVSSILGILSANTVYFILSATSIGAILVSSYAVFFVMKWVGAGYLIFLGLKALLSRESVLGSTTDLDGDRSVRRLYAGGFLLQISNPKALFYFASILPQFVHPKQPVAPQIAILGLTTSVLEVAIQLGYAIVAGQAIEAMRKPNYVKWTNRVAGCILLGTGGGLVMLGRN